MRKNLDKNKVVICKDILFMEWLYGLVDKVSSFKSFSLNIM